MDKLVFEMNKNVINSILTRAENSIYTATGLTLKVVLSECSLEENATGVKHLLSNCAKQLCKIWGVDFETLFVPTRAVEFVVMRQIIYHYVKHKYPSVTLKTIGNNLGNKHHSTIIHSIREVEHFMGKNDEIFNTYFEPIKHLYNEQQI